MLLLRSRLISLTYLRSLNDAYKHEIVSRDIRSDMGGQGPFAKKKTVALRM